MFLKNLHFLPLNENSYKIVSAFILMLLIRLVFFVAAEKYDLLCPLLNVFYCFAFSPPFSRFALFPAVRHSTEVQCAELSLKHIGENPLGEMDGFRRINVSNSSPGRAGPSVSVARAATGFVAGDASVAPRRDARPRGGGPVKGFRAKKGGKSGCDDRTNDTNAKKNS